MKNLVAVIPARGGSKGVPRKNIKLLDGNPLLKYSIDIGLKVFEDVYVSTEDAEIAMVARSLGAKVIDRPDLLSSDASTDVEWLAHAFKVLDCENIAILRPTTPLRDVKIVEQAVNKFNFHPECTSLRSAHEAPESPYKWFEKEYQKPYWKHNAMSDLPRQAFPSMYIPNGYIDITRRAAVEAGTAFGDKIISFITVPIVEIDTQAEFDYLEYLIGNNGSRSSETLT